MSKYLLLFSLLLFTLLPLHAQNDLQITANGLLDGWLVVTIRPLNYPGHLVPHEICRAPYADIAKRTISCEPTKAKEKSEIKGNGKELSGWHVLGDRGEAVCKDPEIDLKNKIIACPP